MPHAELADVFSFDFHKYLFDLTRVEWVIHELSGGNANFVVRAVQANPPTLASWTPDTSEDTESNLKEMLLGCASIVLKQAPPYFAKFPAFAFSQKRQTIEARALHLFQKASPLSRALQGNPCIRVPNLLYYDNSQHVLIQSDLGAHPTLDEFLDSPSTTPESASIAGESLGRFLASIHHAYNDNSTTSTTAHGELFKLFTNEDGEIVMNQVIDNVQAFMKDAGVPDHEDLGHRAREHWRTRKKIAFSQGDIWFGTILVDATSDAPILKICDWEFAGPNDLAADVAQLGAYLHLSILSPLKAADHKHQRILRAFASALYSAHLPPLHSSSDRRAYQRSLLVMHGWELINAAAWRHRLWCDCPGFGVKCGHIRGMISEGVKLLRACGHADGMVDWGVVKDVNWFDASERESLRIAPA